MVARHASGPRALPDPPSDRCLLYALSLGLPVPAASEQAERDEWCDEVLEQAQELSASRAHARQMAADQEARADQVAKERFAEEEHQHQIRRKDQALKNREEALRLAAKLGAARSEDVSGTIAMGGTEVLRKQMGIEQAREAAAAAARANPLAPKKVASAGLGLTVGSGNAVDALPVALPEVPTTASLSKCGYWFEDASDDTVKVTVPLGAVCNGRSGDILHEEGVVRVTFTDLSFRLEVRVDDVTHVLSTSELLHRIDPSSSTAKVRAKSRRVVLELAKYKRGQGWKSLSA